MSKVGGGRNFGYGKNIRWAAKNALQDRYGEGHFSTRASHAHRWNIFAEFLKSESNIKDARDIKRDAIAKYGNHLKQQVDAKRMEVAYAQNLLSTVNTILSIMRKDTKLAVSPAHWAGQRTHVRTHIPSTLKRDGLNQALCILESKKDHPLLLVASFCREFGLRFKEASLLNARTALRQAKAHNQINITEGTKGGRGKRANRWVPVTKEGLKLLQAAQKLQANNKNLIPEKYNYAQWRDHAYSQWRLATKNTSIRGFHDLRAAYACERYQEITDRRAPVLTGNKRTADKELDQKARVIIGLALGHGRSQVLQSYIGSAQ